jgi:hypothetical protein
MEIAIQLSYSKGHYRFVSTTPEEAGYLRSFLLSDVGMHPPYIKLFLEKFESLDYECGAMNATQYDKEEGLDGIVTFMLECEKDDDIAMERGHYFQIRADLVAKVLREWDAVLKEKPQDISITIHGDEVSVVGTGKRQDE